MRTITAVAWEVTPKRITNASPMEAFECQVKGFNKPLEGRDPAASRGVPLVWGWRRNGIVGLYYAPPPRRCWIVYLGAICCPVTLWSSGAVITNGMLLYILGVLLKKQTTARTASIEAGSQWIIHCMSLDMGGKVEKLCPEEGEWLWKTPSCHNYCSFLYVL